MRNQFPSPRGNRSQTSGYEPVKPEEESYIIMDADVEKRSVIVHVTFLKIGEINTLKEQYDADVLLRLKWREPAFDTMKEADESHINWEKQWNPLVYIENKVGEPKLTSSKAIVHEHGEAYVIERRRLKGTFMETLELWEFPFDVQDLSINVMSDLPSTEVELLEDPDEVHKIYRQSFIDEQEWYLYKYIESEKREMQKDRADPTIRRSVLLIRCRAARRPAYFIWNIFSVTFLICCLAFVTFAVKPELTQNRLQLTFTLVLTGVAFKFVVNQSLPRISYLTYLDRYIFATMIMLFCVSIWHGIQTLVDEADKKDYVALVIFACLYFIYNVQFVLRILLVPYKKRRQMKRAEAEYRLKVKEQAVSQSPMKKTSKEKNASDKDGENDPAMV